MSDATLDSLAPTSEAPAVAPTPAPVAQPAAPAAAPASAAPAQPAPPSGQDPAYGQLLKQLGYQSPEDLSRDLAFTRQFREDVARQQAARRQADPAHREAQVRGEAFRQLVAEGYSPEVMDGLARLPEISEFLDAQRADAAQRDLTEGLRAIGITDDGSRESKAELQAWEDAVADRLNSRTQQGLDWNRRYFSTPAERREVIHEIIAHEEGRFNRVLLRQNAQTLRDAAARRQSTAPATRSLATPKVREVPITATDPLGQRRQRNAAAGQQLDDIWSHFGA
jgi:hypothetical protein